MCVSGSRAGVKGRSNLPYGGIKWDPANYWVVCNLEFSLRERTDYAEERFVAGNSGPVVATA